MNVLYLIMGKHWPQNGIRAHVISILKTIVFFLPIAYSTFGDYYLKTLDIVTHHLHATPFTSIKNQIHFTKLFKKNYSDLQVVEFLCYTHQSSTQTCSRFYTMSLRRLPFKSLRVPLSWTSISKDHHLRLCHF